MSAQTPASERRNPAPAQPDEAPRALRLLGLAAVGIGVAALAAATFVLSYPAIHVLALQARVAPRLARGYPLLIDAMLVIVLAAVLALRGAGLLSRLLAWLTLLALLAAAAGAGALHAAGRRLPDHVAAVTVAVLPWVLVFLAFALLLAMLRYARLRRAAAAVHRDTAGHGETAAADPPGAAGAEGSGPHPPVQPVLPVPRQPGPAAVADADPGVSAPLAEHPDLAIEAEPLPDDPSSDEAASEPAGGAMPYPADITGPETGVLSPAATEDEPEDPDMPVFHRMRSAPTPPAGR